MNGKTHRLAGTVAGGAAAYLMSDKADATWQRVVEGVGGAIAGNIGARVPDWLEPAIHPNHRNVCHSVTTIGSMVYAACKTIESWEAHCRAKAQQFAAMRTRDAGLLTWIQSFIGELFWRLSAGALAGFTAGYGSHLALDATTPKRIPLLVRGF